MAEELQALLNRINEQGIQKAEEERKQRLEQAGREARQIVSEAEEQAEQIVSDARQEADLLVEKGRDSLRQAARDTILSLRERLEEQMAAVAREAVAEDLNPEALAGFIGAMIEEHEDATSGSAEIEVQVPEQNASDIEKHLMARLGDKLKEKCEITPLPEMEGGFRLSIEKGDVYYDFSDKALADVLCTFLNPKLAEIVKPALSDEQDSKEKSN